MLILLLFIICHRSILLPACVYELCTQLRLTTVFQGIKDEMRTLPRWRGFLKDIGYAECFGYNRVKIVWLHTWTARDGQTQSYLAPRTWYLPTSVFQITCAGRIPLRFSSSSCSRPKTMGISAHVLWATRPSCHPTNSQISDKQVLSNSWDGRPFGHNRHGPKIGGEGCAPFGRGELGPHLTQCGQGRGLHACQVSFWSVQPFGHNTPTLQTGQDRTNRQTTDR